MPFGYYKRLSRADKAVYRRSDEIASIQVPAPAELQAAAAALKAALEADRRASVERIAQALADALCLQVRVPRVRVQVLEVRPTFTGGELHGLYQPSESPRGRPLISVWMRTVAHKRVVAFKSFLRTLLHELLHHLDFELLQLPQSFHTQGFFKRESSLFHQLVPDQGNQNDSSSAPEAASHEKASPRT